METQHWLRPAFRRELLTADQTASLQAFIDKLPSKLNALINSIDKNRPPSGDSSSPPS